MIERIIVSSDHAGFELKESLKGFLEELGYQVDDVGTYSTEPVDYPIYTLKAAEKVASGEYSRGIVFCSTGQGNAIVANKVPGIRAALCWDTLTAELSRSHNDANMLVLGGRVLGKRLAQEIVRVWMTTPFAGGRHQRRVEQIKAIETRCYLHQRKVYGDKLSQVIPAILTDDPKVLETMVRQAETFTNWVQFDIMDGKFVPSQSITSKHLANLSMKLNWEAHLMVQNPENYLENLRQAGAQKVIFHYEATSSPLEVISLARELGLMVGLATNPDTPISTILPLTDKVDSVLFLSVHPGFYSQKFIPEVLDKIREFGSICPGMETGIDGGIKESNIARVAQAGSDFIYVGSAIFLQEQPEESYRRLVALVQKASLSL